MLYQQTNQLRNFVRGKVRDGPKKLQLTAELKLVKPKLNETSEDTLTRFIKSNCVPVYFFWNYRRGLLSFNGATHITFV